MCGHSPECCRFFENFDKFDYLCNHVEVIWKSVVVASMSNFYQHTITHNEKVFCNAFNNTDEDIVVTSVNEVFSVNEEKLLPEYLVMFLNRTEFDRYARFHSWGSARETFTWDDLIKVKIPIADITIQKAIVDIYTVYKETPLYKFLTKSAV